MLGWEHSQIPSTSKLKQCIGSGGKGELVTPVAIMAELPGSLQDLNFISLPKMWPVATWHRPTVPQLHIPGKGVSFPKSSPPSNKSEGKAYLYKGLPALESTAPPSYVSSVNLLQFCIQVIYEDVEE
ncbi:hypothetical protein TURU_013136 [Turdus rufiventris]|nr:hypothetical protein TURU_013136 [Turdus rufiventris]